MEDQNRVAYRVARAVFEYIDAGGDAVVRHEGAQVIFELADPTFIDEFLASEGRRE